MSNPWDGYANEFTTPQAPTGPFADLVPQAAQQYGVPVPVMNWVGFREGGWNPTVTGIPTSTGKAQGNWQFMPATAKGLAVDPNDPASSTFGAAKYLRSLYDQTGNWTDAVRRYGTFSSGKGPAVDAKLESGFLTHMLNSGLDPATTGPTGPVQVGTHPVAAAPQQSIDPAAVLAGFQKGGQSMPDPTSAAALAQQTPGDTGNLSAATLLRMAAGFAGKKTFGQGLSAAAAGAADGMLQDQQMSLARQQRAQDQQRIGIQQQAADTAQADGRARVIEQAGKLAELGIPPDKAMQIAMAAYQGPSGTAGPAAPPAAAMTMPPAAPQPPITGAGPGTPQPLPPGLTAPASGPPPPAAGMAPPAAPQGLPPGLATPPQAPAGPSGAPTAPQAARAPLWPGMPDLSTLPSTGGKSTAGDLFYSPDGTAFQERNHPYGPPSYFNTATGQSTPTLPQGAMRAQDSYMKSLNQADGAARLAAQKDAMDSQKQLSLLNSYQDLIPQISSGNDMWSTIKRNAATLTGMQIGDTDPTAIQLAQQAQQQLANTRIMMLGHQGLGRINVQEVQAVKNAGANWSQNPQALNIVLNYAKQQEQMKQELWDQWNGASPQTQAKGFQAFQYQFLKDNKVPQMDTSGVTRQPTSGASTEQRPPLTKFGF